MNYGANYSTTLLELAKCGFTGAEFDSVERDPPPRCHPRTRSQIISGIQSWSQNGDRSSLLTWLRGPAGVGKSAIMQSLAEDLSRTVPLGATLFFSRLNGRSNPTRIIATLAYQLAIHVSAYKSHICSLLERDPSILRKSLKQQFFVLIYEPFLRYSCGDHTRLVLIDGLEECDSEVAQRELIALIAGFIRDSPPSTPLLWIISSRPEYHLQTVLGRPGTCIIQDVPVDGSDACADVEKFLHHEFDNIRNNFPDIVPEKWPSSRQFLTIARAASGLFAFAVTVMGYIGDGQCYGDPVSQLNAVVSTLDRHGYENRVENPLATLDVLYTHILSTVPGTSMPVLHLILGVYSLKGNISSLSLVLVANILDLRQNIVYHALQHLHSVLEIPPPREAHKKSLRFFHKSFSDFLGDASRSGALWLDKDRQSIRIALSYVHKFGLILEADNTYQTIPLSWEHAAEPNLQSHIFSEVKQNCFYLLPKLAIRHSLHETELQTLVSVVEKLPFNALDVNDALGFINLVNWIASDSPPVWHQLVSEEIPWHTFKESFHLGLIDSRGPSVYYRTRPDRWGHWCKTPLLHTLTSRSSVKSTHQKYIERHTLSEKDFFEDFVKLGSTMLLNIRVFIIGSNPSRRCAVVLTSVEKQETQPVIRYYFPLKE
ncbi:Vegetative incompatibility protein HET-E-1 [Leucoagaricus sp. SymC.cos]|nr:Vegetative incompatibility protein HET-E-1 [Leucoagaricus sp. SymC.cos]